MRPGGAIAFSAWGSAEETAAFQLIPTVARETLGEEATAPPAGAARRIDGSPAVLSALLRAADIKPERVGEVDAIFEHWASRATIERVVAQPACQYTVKQANRGWRASRASRGLLLCVFSAAGLCRVVDKATIFGRETA